MDELENLKQQLEELRALRNKLAVEEVQEEKADETDLRKSLEEELATIDAEIKEFEDEIKVTAKEYEESYKKLQVIIDEYEKKVGDTKLLSEEELEDLRKVTENLKLEENERSNEIKRRLDAQRKIIRELKSKKTRIENDLEKAEALGLSYDEYKDITSTIRKTSIMNAILEEKGLSEIIAKKANERTSEEKELLKKTKEEILAEISEFKNEHDDYTVLDTIEALYSLDTKYIEVKKPRVIDPNEFNLNNVINNTLLLPHRIIRPDVKVDENVVEEAPKDMENASENEKVDINELKPAEEKVTLFKDKDDYYVRKYAVDRFKLKSADIENEVRINGSLCYKISEEDVNRIKENANNAFSPYIADIKEITLEKEEDKTNEILPEDTKDELIPGTNIKRPRDRGIEETDEEYEAFLKSYYDKVFPKEPEEKSLVVVPEVVNKSLMVIPQPEDTKEPEVRVEPEQKVEQPTKVEPEVKVEPATEPETTTEPIEEYETVDGPIEIEINPDDGIVIDFDDEDTNESSENKITDEQIKEYDALLKDVDTRYIKAEQKAQEKLVVGTPEEIEEARRELAAVRKEYIDLSNSISALANGETAKEELTDDDIKGIVEENLEEELTDDDIKGIVEENLDKEELTDDDIKGVVEENLEEELTDDDIKGIVEENLDKEELTDDDIKGIVEENLDKEELTDEAIVSVVDENIEKEEAVEEENQEEEYKATNVQASEEFKDELKKGNVLYNIVHKGAALAKRVANKLKSFFTPVNDFDEPEDSKTR